MMFDQRMLQNLEVMKEDAEAALSNLTLEVDHAHREALAATQRWIELSARAESYSRIKIDCEQMLERHGQATAVRYLEMAKHRLHR